MTGLLTMLAIWLCVLSGRYWAQTTALAWTSRIRVGKPSARAVRAVGSRRREDPVMTGDDARPRPARGARPNGSCSFEHGQVVAATGAEVGDLVIGWRGVCSCGWEGPSRSHPLDCGPDVRDHQTPPTLRRVMGSDAARAVGRFHPDGPAGYRAATAPDAPLRATRTEAEDDESAWLDRTGA
jgi:hypothetical protein